MFSLVAIGVFGPIINPDSDSRNFACLNDIGRRACQLLTLVHGWVNAIVAGAK